jgi:thymidylate synthase
MAKFDKDYIELCEHILSDGTIAHNRTGNDTIMIPSHNFHFDLREEFPILTTKQVFTRQAILEMLWIWQAQSNDVRWLQERNVQIWNEWMVDKDGIYRIYETDTTNYDSQKSVPVHNLDGSVKVKKDGTIIYAKSIIPGKNIKEAKLYGRKFAYSIGTAYGYIVKKYGLTKSLIETIKNNPEDRRMVKSLWQDCELKTAVLPSCVWSTEWDVTDGYLNLLVHQRSCDIPLGLPFNVTQYATLLCMIAQVTGLKPGTMDWSIKNAHIYQNQVMGIKEQIRRYHELEDYPAPVLWLNPDIKNFEDFDNSKDCEDVKLVKYLHHGKIHFDISQ